MGLPFLGTSEVARGECGGAGCCVWRRRHLMLKAPASSTPSMDVALLIDGSLKSLYQVGL